MPVASAALVSIGWLISGSEARAVGVPDPTLSVLEITVNGGGDFPGDLYADFEWLDMYAISECGPCGEAYFDLFDPALGELVSVDIDYEGALWLDDVGRFYYDDVSWGLSAGYWGDGPGRRFGAGASGLVTTDGGWEAVDGSFSGAFSVRGDQLDAFVRRDRNLFGHADFSGISKVYFPTRESAYFALGGDYDMTIRYGYKPAIAPVPLPPAALLMLGGIGALFAATRRPDGWTRAKKRREQTRRSAPPV